MSKSTQVAGTAFSVHRHTLRNGLRVVISPDRAAPVVGVALVYDVGFRSEPRERTGFAHLFEHLMFQGSENIAKMEHAAQVNSAGGVMNGSTHPDFTNYFEVLPSTALDLALFLEADRMRSPNLDQECLDNQCAVVKEEINVNVRNAPYGGFPWIHLPALLFNEWANAHDGYGSFEDLELASVADCKDFFDRYYAPANAVLVVAGDVDVEEAMALVRKHFDPIRKRSAPKRPSFAEAVSSEVKHRVHVDPIAPEPALAIGMRVPDPIKKPLDYFAAVMLTEVLTAGDSSRLVERLVLREQIANQVSGYMGPFGDPFEMRDPTLLTFEVHHTHAVQAETLIAAVDEEIQRIAEHGVDPAELARVSIALDSVWFSRLDQLGERTLQLGQFELIHGRAELVNEIPGLLRAVTPEDVRRAAVTLAGQGKAILEWKSGASA